MVQNGTKLVPKFASRLLAEWNPQTLGVATYQLEEVVERTVKEIENRK
jgi:hypothetical protein